MDFGNVVIYFCSRVTNKKSAPTEVNARKTQTPIVATQTKLKLGY